MQDRLDGGEDLLTPLRRTEVGPFRIPLPEVAYREGEEVLDGLDPDLEGAELPALLG